METLRIKDNSELPKHLYRVLYAGSRTVFVPWYGLLAESQSAFDDSTHLGMYTVGNLRWKERKPVPFINLFPRFERALTFAYNRLTKKKSNTSVLTIDTTKLGDAVVFKISNVVRELNLKTDIDDAAEQDAHEGYMCLYQIPAAAIVDVLPISGGIDISPRQSQMASKPTGVSAKWRKEHDNEASSRRGSTQFRARSLVASQEGGIMRRLLQPLCSQSDFEEFAKIVKTNMPDIRSHDDRDMEEQWFMDEKVILKLKEYRDDVPRLMHYLRLRYLQHYAINEPTSVKEAMLMTGVKVHHVWKDLTNKYDVLPGNRYVDWDRFQEQLSIQTDLAWKAVVLYGDVDTLKKLLSSEDLRKPFGDACVSLEDDTPSIGQSIVSSHSEGNNEVRDGNSPCVDVQHSDQDMADSHSSRAESDQDDEGSSQQDEQDAN